MDIADILIVSDNSTAQNHCTVSVWDPNTKNALQVHRGGGIAGPHAVDQIGNDYIVTADNAKPLLHIWPVNSQNEVKQLRLVMPSIATVVTVCPHRVYLAAAIGLKIYIWHLSSGRLLAVEQKHFQPITCIKFSSDGDLILVGGGDGMLVVWKLAALISMQNNSFQSEMGHVEPVYCKMDHTAPITDIHVGIFGNESTIVTVSADHTLFLYKLSTGTKLLHVIFNEPLTCTQTDNIGLNIYIGTKSGGVHLVNLLNPPRNVEYHIKESENELCTFVGHEKQVNCLSLSTNCSVLATGSNDCKVIVWDVRTQNMLLSLPFKGAITNVKFSISNPQMFTQDFKPKVCIQSLQRSLDMNNEKFNASFNQNETIVLDNTDVDFNINKNVPCKADNNYQSDLLKIKCINHELYKTGYKVIKHFYNIE